MAVTLTPPRSPFIIGLMIIRGPHAVSDYADADGNFRAINPRHAGFVGYGRSKDEAAENLNRAIRQNNRANPRAMLEAAFMVLSEAEQTEVIASLPALRRS